MRYSIAFKRSTAADRADVVVLDEDADLADVTDQQLVLLASNCDQATHDSLLAKGGLIVLDLPPDAPVQHELFPEIPPGKVGMAFKEFDIVFGCSAADAVMGYSRQIRMIINVLR